MHIYRHTFRHTYTCLIITMPPCSLSRLYIHTDRHTYTCLIITLPPFSLSRPYIHTCMHVYIHMPNNYSATVQLVQATQANVKLQQDFYALMSIFTRKTSAWQDEIGKQVTYIHTFIITYIHATYIHTYINKYIYIYT